MEASVNKREQFGSAHKIAQTIHRIVYYGAFIGTVVLLILMLLTTADVAGRKFIDRPVPGAYELAAYMLAVIVLLGLGFAQQSEANVRIEFLTDKMARNVQGFFVAFFALGAAVFFSLLVWQGITGSIKAMQTNMGSDVLHIPSYPFQFLVSVGALFLVLELLIKFIATVYHLITATYVKREMGKEVQGLD
jgi:TRAP-type C4-dicarboxylate transport system permease small subunit